jgi:universal stress protein A
MPTPRRILCPTDFSESAQFAFDYADRLAAEAGAELVLIHAFDKPMALTVAGQSLPADHRLREQLDGIHCIVPNSKVKRILHVGPPGEAICWLASHEECDLIVMGTHGHTGWRHLMIGSVAEYVVRHAPCPVLTVRMQVAREPAPKEPRMLPIPAPRMM